MKILVLVVLLYSNKGFLVYGCVQVCGCRYLSGASSSSQICYSLAEVSKRLRDLVEGAMQSIWVATAFIDRCGVDLLKKAGGRGAQVRVLTSAEVDEDILRELARFAEVRIIKERFMHAKMYIADGKALIGSANLTCPVLEDKNIEILCEVRLEEAVKRFNELWTSAGGIETVLQPKELWLRIKDTSQRIVIESRIGKGLYVEIDKLLKRPIVKYDKNIVPCPIKVEEMCIEYIDRYNSLANAAIEYVKSYSIDSCLWNDRIVIPDNLKEYVSTHGYGEYKVSPIAFIVIGLYPIVSSMCSSALSQELARRFGEELKKLDVEIATKCRIVFESRLEVCLRFLEKPKVSIIYRLYTQDSSCFASDQSVLNRLRNVVNQVLSNVKSLFEERMRRLYEEYQRKLQNYGTKPVEIDGLLTAKLHVDALGVADEFEVELGTP
jgi:hypothetical protein